jgi:hypothetical protein
MEIKGIEKQNILPSGMLMQEAEVRSSVGQHVHSYNSKNVVGFLKCIRPQLRCVRPQLRCVRPQKSTASLSRVRARTQMRGARTQMQGARTQMQGARTQARGARTQMRERPGIGGSAFDRKYCVRPHCRRLICPGTETES